VPTRTMYRLAQRHNVPAVKVGRTWRFRGSSLDTYLERLMLERAPGDAAPAAAPTIAPRAELGSLESDGWDEMPGELATLAGPGEIAHYLDTHLRQIYHVDVVGLMRLQGDELVTLVESDELGVPTGARFTLEPTSPSGATSPVSSRISTPTRPTRANRSAGSGSAPWPASRSASATRPGASWRSRASGPEQSRSMISGA
jgi:excisionase family DNA binding protein